MAWTLSHSIQVPDFETESLLLDPAAVVLGDKAVFYMQGLSHDDTPDGGQGRHWYAFDQAVFADLERP